MWFLGLIVSVFDEPIDELITLPLTAVFGLQCMSLSTRILVPMQL